MEERFAAPFRANPVSNCVRSEASIGDDTARVDCFQRGPGRFVMTVSRDQRQRQVQAG
jgi:hypothetical protein